MIRNGDKIKMNKKIFVVVEHEGYWTLIRPCNGNSWSGTTYLGISELSLDDFEKYIINTSSENWELVSKQHELEGLIMLPKIDISKFQPGSYIKIKGKEEIPALITKATEEEIQYITASSLGDTKKGTIYISNLLNGSTKIDVIASANY